MASVSLELRDEPVPAAKVLKVAQQALVLLRQSEKAITHKRPVVEWHVDILSTFSGATIKLTSVGQGEVERWAYDTTREAMNRMKARVEAMGDRE